MCKTHDFMRLPHILINIVNSIQCQILHKYVVYPHNCVVFAHDGVELGLTTVAKFNVNCIQRAQ